MKKVKLVKKALLPAVIAVCCSLLALTSVSYAWFTLGNEAKVDSFDVNVTLAEGLQISADAENWKSTLTIGELANSTLYQVPTKGIFPTSSAGEVAGGQLNIFYGSYKSDILTVEKLTDGTTYDPDGANTVYQADYQYIAFDLYVKLDKETDLKLSSTSKVEAVTENKNTHTAVRVAFVNLGTDDTNTVNTAKALGSSVATTGAETDSEIIRIWEPNSLLDVKGDAKAKSGYKGVKGVNSSAATNTSNATLSTEDVTTFDLNNAAEPLFEDLKAGITKIRVYIWLEGQDVECINDISGATFKVSLNFEVPESQQPAA